MRHRRARPRNRLLYGAAVVAVIALGLASRKYAAWLPAALDKSPGDTLWALMIFLGYCTLAPRAGTWKVAGLALLTCYGVEFSQLYQAPWINAIRATTPGHLVLGSTFHWPDLVAYTVGIATGAILDIIGASKVAVGGNAPT
ncbi:MAG: DUF2809 domain-containing protein [Rhodocyclales bacterium]|nr:DUF2809 domain-containing protein [Rhodocyclales bacterium]